MTHNGRGDEDGNKGESGHESTAGKYSHQPARTPRDPYPRSPLNWANTGYGSACSYSVGSGFESLAPHQIPRLRPAAWLRFGGEFPADGSPGPSGGRRADGARERPVLAG